LVLDGAARHPLAPSVDRRDPRRGYTARNCRVICYHLNSALNAFGEDEFAAMCSAFLGYYACSRGRVACWSGAFTASAASAR